MRQDAANNGHTAVVDLLIDAGEYVNEPTERGEMALHFACRGAFIDTAILLIDAGAEVRASHLFRA